MVCLVIAKCWIAEMTIFVSKGSLFYFWCWSFLRSWFLLRGETGKHRLHGDCAGWRWALCRFDTAFHPLADPNALISFLIFHISAFLSDSWPSATVSNNRKYIWRAWEKFRRGWRHSSEVVWLWPNYSETRHFKVLSLAYPSEDHALWRPCHPLWSHPSNYLI